jgi:hypothetical protein
MQGTRIMGFVGLLGALGDKEAMGGDASSSTVVLFQTPHVSCSTSRVNSLIMEMTSQFNEAVSGTGTLSV